MSFSTDGVPDADLVSYSFRPLVPIPPFFLSFLLGTLLIDTNSEVQAVNVLLALISASALLNGSTIELRDAKFDWLTGLEFLAQQSHFSFLRALLCLPVLASILAKLMVPIFLLL